MKQQPPRFMTPSSFVYPDEFYAIKSKVFYGWYGRCAHCLEWINVPQAGALAVAKKYEGETVEEAPYAICDTCLKAGYCTNPAMQRKVWIYLFGIEPDSLIVYK